MRVKYHPDVRQDVAEAMRRYNAVSKTLANDFRAELRRVVAMAVENPNRLSRNDAIVRHRSAAFMPLHRGFYDDNQLQSGHTSR